jgi:hypothetical protein
VDLDAGSLFCWLFGGVFFFSFLLGFWWLMDYDYELFFFPLCFVRFGTYCTVKLARGDFLSSFCLGG